jgi:hypothetical protein
LLKQSDYLFIQVLTRKNQAYDGYSKREQGNVWKTKWQEPALDTFFYSRFLLFSCPGKPLRIMKYPFAVGN